VQSLLRDDGLCLLHSIFNEHSAVEPWLNRYIFPNGMLPSRRDVASAVHRRFFVEDEHSIGPNYDRTLMAWHENLERHEREADGPHLESERFRRMWRYYLLSCAGSFRVGTRNQVYQLVLSKRRRPNYVVVR
jgi:cyclopropane-fatty-acyl-phospholipid synthase